MDINVHFNWNWSNGHCSYWNQYFDKLVFIGTMYKFVSEEKPHSKGFVLLLYCHFLVWEDLIYLFKIFKIFLWTYLWTFRMRAPISEHNTHSLSNTKEYLVLNTCRVWSKTVVILEPLVFNTLFRVHNEKKVTKYFLFKLIIGLDLGIEVLSSLSFIK